MLAGKFFAVSGAQNDGNIGPDPHHFIGQLVTGHVGHYDIGDDQVESIGIRFEKIQGFDTARSGINLVAQTLEHLLSDFHQGLLVIHKENALIPHR